MLLSTFESFSFLGYSPVITIIISLLNPLAICFVSSKLLQILQLSGYKLSGYFLWLKDTNIKFISRLFFLSFLSLISMLVTTVLLKEFGDYFSYVSLIFYIYFCVVFIVNIQKSPKKTPLKQTHRVNRLIITMYIIIAAITYFLIILAENFFPIVRHAVLTLIPPMALLIVPLANIINLPIELLIRSKYIKKAKAKLEKMPDLIKIGITGSFGKTTTKHILNVMLSKKYSVCMTPHSFNTPMGLTKVINKYLKKDNQVLITEMGARNVGDIKYLCDLVQPRHAIITAVGSQHLASFGSINNIERTKNELVECIKDGFVVFNGNNSGSMNLYKKCYKTKYISSVEQEGSFCNIKNVQVSENGSSFDLTIEDNTVKCETVLLGKHILEDIALSAVMAYKLGVSLEQIAQAISELKPIAHRMEILKNSEIVVLDNSYNSSVESSQAALDTLKLFNSDNKIIVTPGIVEMGAEEKLVNYEFGQHIAGVCNKVVIVNKHNREAIEEGLLDEDFSKENIYYAETLKEVTAMLPNITSKGCVVLFENDLPDNYT